ncbi:hypothetical protein GCM10011346_33940 [Oceanobacillus neutriphilus]|uniref:Holin-like toxin n=1 Tax=Oceanobacillus neutriphilus TaxID=531815 RepID=A0ABQ2NY75_9BACI|nr:hypothetical protein GCM10011346_33940 [Oceanobacillus neutriphilus]
MIDTLSKIAEALAALITASASLITALVAYKLTKSKDKDD